jgi:hypothetical protein
MNQAAAQEQAPPDYYGRPTPPTDVQPQEPTEQPQEPTDLWGKFQKALSTFVPPQQPGERPIEQPLDSAVPGESPAAKRQALWEAATKLKTPDESETESTFQPKVTLPHDQGDCLDPSKFQPGLAGYLDYYLFTIVDTGPKEVYLTGEHGKEPFCLTNVDTEDLKKTQLVVVPGNVRVRGTKTYKTAKGDKLTVRVVKLLSPKESEAVDAERSLEKTEYPLRAWTSKDGKHKIEARFLKFLGGKVHLMSKAGKSITISPNDLSLEDREYYRDLVKKAREAARKADEKDEDEEAESLEPF